MTVLGFVYFITCDDGLKIGHSDDELKAALAALRRKAITAEIARLTGLLTG